MIVAGRFGALWAYLLGPTIGGVLGALLYNKFLGHSPGTGQGADHSGVPSRVTAD